MKDINENDFGKIDLNLLIVLVIMVDERSVTNTAKRLHLGQPAMSAALKRLREMFDDPLFIRTSEGMLPTSRAEKLVALFRPALQNFHRAIFDFPVFNPAADSYNFRIGMSDWVEHWLMADLLEIVSAEAPGITITVLASDPYKDLQMIKDDKADVIISVGKDLTQEAGRENLVQFGFKTVWDRKQIDIKKPLSIDDFIKYDHLLVSYRGANQSLIDSQLALSERQRTVKYVTPNFASQPLILSRLPVLTTVPEGLVDVWCKLYHFDFDEVPVETSKYHLSLLWNNRREKEPAIEWILRKLKALILDKTKSIHADE
ncbi:MULTISPECIES: LysR family transcriptional regulator [Rahnella]|uniref:LysR family transcriptional regulator n=1 Tax=Rahnella laticis TaxID=2787622 RepID=A0ABS0E0K5_9GAMM|nr:MULTISPECIES: LysR family transcriptional regulator [Rahnella]MBF7978602.1 LysR family transcriptional regulator [Rahnella laticis]MBF7998692.1 LysR family transcriptional regulator [Rahnella sp. LAC-M12]